MLAGGGWAVKMRVSQLDACEATHSTSVCASGTIIEAERSD